METGGRSVVTLLLGDTSPSDGSTDATQVVAVWRELALLAAADATPPLLVSRGADAIFQIVLDVSDTVDMLDRVAAEDPRHLEERWDQRAAAGLHPMGSWIGISITEVSGRSSQSGLPEQLLGRFLQQVFLAMNLALPGSASLLASSYRDVSGNDYPPPHLSSDILERAYTKARERGWPLLRRLALRDVWNWLHDAMSYDLDLATEPSDKALFALLRVSEPQTVDVDNVLRVAQASEALFAGGREGISAILHERLTALLGEPTSHKRWFTKFYDLRSRIAHGSIPVLRPGAYYDFGDNAAVEKYIAEFWEPIDQALAVLLAVIQDLIVHGCRGYRFEQRVVRSPQ